MKLNQVSDYLAPWLKKLEVEDLRGYLRCSGWSLTCDAGPLSLWNKVDASGSLIEIEVPHRKVASYSTYVTLAVHNLTIAEGRGANEVLKDLSRSACDYIRLRLVRNDSWVDNITIDDAEHLLSCSKDLLDAGTGQALRRHDLRNVSEGLSFTVKSRKARETLKKVPGLARIGQTEVGSYIYVIEVPLGVKWAEFDAEPLLFEDRIQMATPAREATSAAESAIEATVKAGQGALERPDQLPALFLEALGSGLTSSLSESLGKTLRSAEELEVLFNFAPLGAPPKSTSRKLAPKLSEPLLKAVPYLKGTTKLGTRTVVGYISNFRRGEMGGDEAKIDVRTIGEKAHMVSMRVSGDAYKLAAQSLVASVLVVATGQIEEIGKTKTMQVDTLRLISREQMNLLDIPIYET